MLDINSQVRIECQRALKEVQKIKGKQRKVFENEESDLQYSKLFSKQYKHSYKLTEIRNPMEYKASKITAEFLTHANLYFKSSLAYEKLNNYLKKRFQKKGAIDNGSKLVPFRERQVIKIKRAEVLAKLNRNVQVCNILGEIDLNSANSSKIG
jgi:hypothetical protein